MYGEKQKVRALTKILRHAWRQLTKRKDNERQREDPLRVAMMTMGSRFFLAQSQLGERAPRASGLLPASPGFLGFHGTAVKSQAMSLKNHWRSLH